MTNYIWVTTQKEMIHQYPDAPEGVEFLKHPHRHLFKFKIYTEVFHDDREIEFILFKRFVDKLINSMDKDLKTKSCEMISNFLYNDINSRYPDRDVIIEVSEDGENGSRYFYSKENQTINNNKTLNDFIDKNV